MPDVLPFLVPPWGLLDVVLKGGTDSPANPYVQACSAPSVLEQVDI